MPDHIPTKYLRPQADRALREWYAERYINLPLQHRAALVEDVAGIMVEEELAYVSGFRDPAGVAVMILDERIYPAPLSDYARSLSADKESWS